MIIRFGENGINMPDRKDPSPTFVEVVDEKRKAFRRDTPKFRRGGEEERCRILQRNFHCKLQREILWKVMVPIIPHLGKLVI